MKITDFIFFGCVLVDQHIINDSLLSEHLRSPKTFTLFCDMGTNGARGKFR